MTILELWFLLKKKKKWFHQQQIDNLCDCVVFGILGPFQRLYINARVPRGGVGGRSVELTAVFSSLAQKKK